MQTSYQRLERQIEALVKAHLEDCRMAAVAAVDRAFATAMSKPTAVKQKVRKTPRVQCSRRGPEEMARIEELLYAEVCATPGETMSVLAARLGMPSRRLKRPRKRLERAGRIRMVGRNNSVRYFPMVEERAAETKLAVVGKGS